jgi:hypothetical protein
MCHQESLQEGQMRQMQQQQQMRKSLAVQQKVQGRLLLQECVQSALQEAWLLVQVARLVGRAVAVCWWHRWPIQVLVASGEEVEFCVALAGPAR